MSDILLQTIIEKLSTIEVSLLKENTNKDPEMETLLKEIKLLQAEMIKWPFQFKENSEKLNELLNAIASLNFKLESSKRDHIKHRHHLHRGVWIAIGLFIISLLFLYGWINCSNTKNAFEDNDIKYRYLKVFGNTNLLKATYQTDSLYNLNEDYFIKHVVEKEHVLVEQAEQFRLASEKKKEDRELRNKGRKSLIDK
jgi:hypothetical protein